MRISACSSRNPFDREIKNHATTKVPHPALAQKANGALSRLRKTPNSAVKSGSTAATAAA
jgi:hypothetical protein